MFLLLGDYYTPFPWTNEIVETIRGIDSVVAIRGNGEGYLINLRGQNQNEWTSEQFKPIYWSYRTLKPENLEYLITLPETAVVSYNGDNIYLFHSMNIFFRSKRIDIFHSSNFRKMMEILPFTHEEYLVRAKKEILSRSDALADILALPKGIYLFGHNHLQFYMEYEGRIFINPGSCGVSCDCDTTAAYTILEYCENGWEVIERRVKYDLNLTAKGLRNSSFTVEAPFWG